MEPRVPKKDDPNSYKIAYAVGVLIFLLCCVLPLGITIKNLISDKVAERTFLESLDAASNLTSTPVPRLPYAGKMTVTITGGLSEENIYSATVTISTTSAEPTESARLKFIVRSNFAACDSGLTLDTSYKCELNNSLLEPKNSIPINSIRVSIPGCFQDLALEVNADRSFVPIVDHKCDP